MTVGPAVSGWMLAVVLALGPLAGPTEGQAPPSPTNATPEGGFLITGWQTEDGLPESSVKSIAQTPDGYLWLATFAGLVRFDGIRFTVFDTSNTPDLPSSRLVQLLVDHESGLWVVTEYREVARLATGRCRRFGPADGMPPSGGSWVGEDAGGRLWLADPAGGLHRLEEGKFVHVVSPSFGSGRLARMVNDSEGGVWLQQGERLARFAEGRFVVLRGQSGEAEATVKQVCASRDGGLWVVTAEGLGKYRGGKLVSGLWPCPDFKTHLQDMVEDLAGNVWLAAYGGGLFCFHPPDVWRHYTGANGLTDRRLWCLFCDGEGNIWVGTNGGGLYRIQPRLWRMVSRADGLGVDAVASLSEDQQARVWMAGWAANPYWWRQGLVEMAIDSPLSDRMGSVCAVLAARDGAVWIGTYRGEVFRYEGGALTSYSATDGMLAGAVRALLEDRCGVIWVGGVRGLCRIEGRQATSYSRKDGLRSERVWALAEDAKGALYVGTSEGGLHQYRNGKLTPCPEAQALPDESVAALYVDAEDTLWIGTRGGGLSRLRQGKIANLREVGGLPGRRVSPILEDDYGYLWLGSDLGFVRASRRELNEFADGQRHAVSFSIYDRSDGLATTETGGIQPAAWRAHDGRLWFGTSKGAAYVDPKELRVNPHPPPVVIEEVRIDDKPVQSNQTGARAGEAGGRDAAGCPAVIGNSLPTLVKVLPAQQRVEFDYTALTFTAPRRARFRCRLEGWDRDWIEVGTRRTAYYTRLPPGQYRFQVTACNNDGVWNETGAAMGLLVIPPWWRTWWFYGGAVVAFGGLALSGYKWRIRGIERVRALQEAFARQLIASQEGERKRIAAELHDGLGQDLLLIKNRAVLGLREPGVPAGAVEQLSEISAVASEAINDVRAAAHALRPYELDRLGLTKAVEAMIERVAATTQLKFFTQLDDVAGLFPPETEINFYRILQEGINNVVKHARAREVILELKREPGRMSVRLQDDGRGFDLAARQAGAAGGGGMGLSAMAERARIIGAGFQVQSAPGKGVCLTLTAPLAAQREHGRAD